MPRTQYTRECAFCGEPFQYASNDARQRYCSLSCATRARGPFQRTQYTGNCAACGAPFQTVDPDQRFCSRPCGWTNRRRRPIAERFWEKVCKESGVWWNGTQCWHWLARLNPSGYGWFGVGGNRSKGGRMKGAHCVAYELAYGPIPEGLCVLHHCDNPRCVNPTHLFIGTRLDNVRDMWEKGRQGRPNPVVGEAHHKTVLTDIAVSEIRAAWTKGGITQRELGERFGVGQGTIGNIVRRFTWKHLP